MEAYYLRDLQGKLLQRLGIFSIYSLIIVDNIKPSGEQACKGEVNLLRLSRLVSKNMKNFQYECTYKVEDIIIIKKMIQHKEQK